MNHETKVRKLNELMEASPKEYCQIWKYAILQDLMINNKGDGSDLDKLLLMMLECFIKKIKNNAKRAKILCKKIKKNLMDQMGDFDVGEHRLVRYPGGVGLFEEKNYKKVVEDFSHIPGVKFGDDMIYREFLAKLKYIYDEVQKLEKYIDKQLGIDAKKEEEDDTVKKVRFVETHKEEDPLAMLMESARNVVVFNGSTIRILK